MNVPIPGILTPEEIAELEGAPAGQPEANPGSRSPRAAVGVGARHPSQARVVASFKEQWQHDALPPDLVVPGEGVAVAVVRFRKGLTEKPDRGDRSCVVWNLTWRDERFAQQRAKAFDTNLFAECAREMIRATDGRSLPPGDPVIAEKFWDEIGPKYRSSLVSWYFRSHNLEDAERARFFTEDVLFATAR